MPSGPVSGALTGPTGINGSVPGQPSANWSDRSYDTGDREPARRSAESIDVGAFRRTPPPASGEPPAVDYQADQGEFPWQQQQQQEGYPAGPPPSYASSAGYGAPGPYAGGTPSPLSAPTAAVSTIRPSVYQSRRPTLAIILAVLLVLFEIPALRLLISAAIADNVAVSGVVAGTFLVAGLPVFGFGLFGLLGGPAGPPAASGAAPGGLATAWSRPPLLFLAIGVVFFVCAALAAA